MMNQQQPPSFNDDFEQMLSARLQQAQPYLSDDNFTTNVMQTLSTRKALSPLQERLIKIIPVLIISVLVLSQFSAVAIFAGAWKLLFTLNSTHLLQLGSAMALAISSCFFWRASCPGN
jgi:hypothetical protein